MIVRDVDYYLDRVSLLAATGFFSGYFPIAPGTFASLVAIPVVLALKAGPASVYAAVTVGLLMLGIVVSDRVEALIGKMDPSIVVIDEIVGFLVAMAFVEPNLLNLVLAFFIFRFFDIFKPLGIRSSERLGGGSGIMMDDFLSGFVTNVILQVLNVLVF